MVRLNRPVNPLALVLLLSVAFFIVFMLVSGVLVLTRGPIGSGQKMSGTSFFSKGSGTVAVVELKGVILDSRKTLAKLERLAESDQVKAVVLRLNSPGGAVAPAQEIYEYVKSYAKPVVVSMASVAASGAYYIACGAKKVFANPGSMTGSIGVIMEFANLEKLYDWAKIQRYAIKTGQFKDVGAEYRSMTEKEKTLLQAMVNNILGQFKDAVVEGRNLPPEAVSEVADGRIFTGSQAKELDLVDELGTIHDAIKEAAKLGKIEGKPHVYYVDRQKKGLLDLLFNDSSLDDPTNSESSIKNLLLNSLLSILTGGKLAGGSLSGNSLGWAQGSASGWEGSDEGGRVPGVYWIWGGAGVY